MNSAWLHEQESRVVPVYFFIFLHTSKICWPDLIGVIGNNELFFSCACLAWQSTRIFDGSTYNWDCGKKLIFLLSTSYITLKYCFLIWYAV